MTCGAISIETYAANKQEKICNSIFLVTKTYDFVERSQVPLRE